MQRLKRLKVQETVDAQSATGDAEKLDVAVLQYQNQKLLQQLEAQKVEYYALENKFHQLKEKQENHNDTLLAVNNSWVELVRDLESCSVCSTGIQDSGNTSKNSSIQDDGASCSREDDFFNRLLETGATESSADYACHKEMEDDMRMKHSDVENILRNMLSSISCMWHAQDEVAAALLVTAPEDERSKQLQRTTNDLLVEVGKFQVAVGELHLKHRLLANKVQNHRDMDAKNKADHKQLAAELATTIGELEESNCKLATLKAQRDATQGSPRLFRTVSNKHVGGVRDKQKELQDMECTLKEIRDLVSSRLVEIRKLHEERVDILKKLANLQSSLMDVNGISSSKTFLLLSGQLDKSKTEMEQCRISLEKLQVEKDNFLWHEKEVSIRADLADVSQGISAFSESRIAALEQQLQKLAVEKISLDTKLETATREPGRKEIIEEFKGLVASLPKDMVIMQSQLRKYKETASELHSLRAEVRSLSSVLDRKANMIEALSIRSNHQLSEITNLEAVVRDLRQSDEELKLIQEMYGRESTDTWDVRESQDMEYKAWAHVQSLKSSLDEHNLELRVKEANEAEAISQQRLATSEAEIADLRQKLEVSSRDICKLSETLKSKHEEGESYLSEIESIGQAYEDMQTQNQHLLQQITERDDYNVKLYMEIVKSRQLEGALRGEIQTMEKEVKQRNSIMDFYHMKADQLDDQLRIWSEQVGKLADDGRVDSITVENAERRFLDLQRQSQQLSQSLYEKQTKVERSRLDVAQLLIELDKERFNKKRAEEELEIMSRKARSLKQSEGSIALEKLQQEIREYKGILKCGICHNRQKEVVIAKCYHLFCSQCVQRTLESRHRKCPTCGTGFGHNDVKPIYI